MHAKKQSNGKRSIGLRGKAACLAARAAITASRLSGRGAGGMIGGEVARKVDPHLGRKLAAGKDIVLVTGTNGKSTTTKMLRSALRLRGEVASNTNGDNMESGVLTALLQHPHHPYAAIEVDELHLGKVAREYQPAGFVLLNLSRDQLDRTGEIARVEKHIRDTVNQYPQAVVVANCDDPLIVSAAWDCPNVVWVAAGCSWTADSISFPRTATMVIRKGNDWSVLDHPEYRRPQPSYWLDGDDLVWIENGSEQRVALQLALPGRANRGNAAEAIAAAHAFGVAVTQAAQQTGLVQEVAGRYLRTDLNGRSLRLLLAKNPAGWQEALTMLSAQAETIILAVNGQVPDGKDLSWLWDVNFEHFAQLSEQRIIACGERGADLAVRLRYAGCDVELTDTPQDAVALAAPGQVDMLLNYTSFRDFKRFLEQQGASK